VQGADVASAPMATVRRGQLWRTTQGSRMLVIGRTSGTRLVVGYVYGENQLSKVADNELAELLQEVCLPYVGKDVPELRPVGRFSWDAESGYRQLPKEFTADTGVTTLVRQEDAELAIMAALQSRDATLASLQRLREAV